MKRLPISVCMIAGNEARRIGQALESVAGWTSEIIVVLNEEVSDGTDTIALRYGAKVYREPWKGYIAQKNSAAAKATQSWILGLDADEVVSQPLRDEIANVLGDPTVEQRFAAFSFPRCTWFCGRWIKHGDWYPDRQVRLWRRGCGRWDGTDPHDRLQVTGRVGKMHGELLHYSYQSLRQMIEKALKYADYYARQCEAQNRRVSYCSLLLRPAWRFFRSYVLRLGFLDGWQGLTVAYLGAVYTFLRYARVIEEAVIQKHH